MENSLQVGGHRLKSGDVTARAAFAQTDVHVALFGGVVQASMNTTEHLEALRRRLRSGTLPIELLPPGHGVVLRWREQKVTRDALRTHAGEIAAGLIGLEVKLPRNAMGKIERSKLAQP